MTQGGGGVEGRSTAIILFTDLVGSTELRSRLGEAAAEELRHRHDALLGEAIQRNRGRLVKNLGDGIMATFAGASDAVGAAMAIQQAIARHNRSGAEAGLEVRIGISAGDVTFEEGDYFGTPVIEAARLCGAAQGGQILSSETARWLARSPAGTFTPVGNLELKGLPEPVPTVEIGWEPPPQPPVPLPTFLTEIGRIFVGRDPEMDRLRQLWQEAAGGELRVAFVAGEPGIGKTRLAAELARALHDEGAAVLAGRCDEDLGVPYQPFVEALRHYVDHVADLSDRLGRYRGELVRLVPELTDRVPGLPAPLRSDPQTERYRLFEAVAAWLTAASNEEPLLLVLDDLQWAAKPTLMLLRHVVRAAGAGRILMLGTYRDTELIEGHPLLEVVPDLRRQGGVERLLLAGLDDAGVAAVVEQASGRVLDESGLALARAVYEETDGNPFFLREVLRHLAEIGAVGQGPGSWAPRVPVDQLGIPEGVREVVGRRLARLSGEANQVLRVAAVVGQEFELGVVQAAGVLSEETLLRALDEAAAARLVLEVSATRLRFAHSLVRATLYDSLTAARQVALHRHAAEAIERMHRDGLDDHLPALAHHWAKASAPVTDTTKAVEYAQRAGDRALAQLAHDEAARYYASALDLLQRGGADPSDPRRVDLLIGRGEAQRRAADPGYRGTLLEAARLALRLGDARLLARAALANSLGHIWTGLLEVDAARVEMLQAALAAVGDRDLRLRARLLATLGLELAWEPDAGRRLALSEEALSIARSLGDPETLGSVLLARDYTITAPDNVDERFAATTELLAMAEKRGDPVLASRALCIHFKAAMELANVAEAERCQAQNRALVAELGQPDLTWAAMHHYATLRILRCEADAEEAVDAAYHQGVAANRPAVAVFSAAHRWSLRLDQRRVEEMEGFMRQIVERTQYPMMKSGHALIVTELGRTEEAAAVFDEFAATGFAHSTNNVAWLRFTTDCAWLCARLGRRDCAPLLRSRLEPFADQLVVIAFAGGVTGTVALYLGLLCTTAADWPAAEKYFGAAATTHQRIQAPAWLARTHLEWARMLQGRNQPGDADRADRLLQQALSLAREHGLPGVECDAGRLLSGA